MTAASTPREVMAAALYNAAWQGGITGTVTGTAWDVARPSEREPYYRRIDQILSALAEAGWEVARLELEGWRNPAPSGWGYDDFWQRDDDPEMPPPDDWIALYRKLEPQEES